MSEENLFLNRTIELIGYENVKKLNSSKVAIFGLGGVGSSVVESLSRSGIGEMLIVDFDKVDITNINRQLIATFENIGENKVDVEYRRIKSINPEIIVHKSNEKVDSSNISSFALENYDYVVDAIDDLNAKIAIIKYCKEKNIRIISAMGAGNRIDPTRFKISDIYDTYNCPMARKMRKLLKMENIDSLKVVFSDEKPKKIKNNVIASIAFIPPVAGMVIASAVVRDLIM